MNIQGPGSRKLPQAQRSRKTSRGTSEERLSDQFSDKFFSSAPDSRLSLYKQTTPAKDLVKVSKGVAGVALGAALGGLAATAITTASPVLAVAGSVLLMGSAPLLAGDAKGRGAECIAQMTSVWGVALVGMMSGPLLAAASFGALGVLAPKLMGAK